MNERSFAQLLPGPAQRTSARRGAAKMAGLYLIEGEYVTANELARRMGVDKVRALKKLGRLRAQPGPVTWAMLGVVAPKKENASE